MWLMTGVALSLGKWGMCMLKLLVQAGMTTEAGCRKPVFQQSGLSRSMRGMTPKAISLLDRVVDKAFELLGSGFRVTGVTQILYLLLKQVRIAGNMRVVAGEASADSNRLMRYPTCKIFTVMAGQTFNLRRGQPLGRQDDEQRCAQNQYGF
jgi:hypothetical protein